MSASRRIAVLALAVLLPLGAPLAVQVPPRPAGRVTDLAGLLSPDQRQALEDRLAAFERETTNQVVVLIVPSLEGEPVDGFSHQVATTWKLGRAGVDNGVLLLVALRDRKVRIEVGYGLEPSLPDGLAGEIIREGIAPRFRRGDYFGGITEALDRIFTATRKADLAAVPARLAQEARRSLGSRLALYLLVGLGLFGLAHPFARRFMGVGFWALFGLSGLGLGAGALAFGAVPWGSLGAWMGLGVALGVVEAFVEEQFRCPRCGRWLRRSVAPVGGAAQGDEVVTSTCPGCKFRSRTVRHAALGGALAGAAAGFFLGGGGGWGGGGDGGFTGGGGDFGGGGASGDW